MPVQQSATRGVQSPRLPNTAAATSQQLENFPGIGTGRGATPSLAMGPSSGVPMLGPPTTPPDFPSGMPGGLMQNQGPGTGLAPGWLGAPPQGAQLQGIDPGLNQNQAILQAAGLGPNSGNLNDPRYVNYASEGAFQPGASLWPGFSQGQYPWPTPDPTESFPTPMSQFPMGWNSYPVANAQMGMMNALVPGFGNTIPPGYAGFDPASRANQFNLMSGIFANDPMQLPGEQGGPMLGAAANLTLGQALNREGRNEMAQQGLLDAIFRTGNNPGMMGSSALSAGLTDNPFTTSNDALQKEVEGILSRGLANAREGALSTAQGAIGAAGTRGGESALLESGLDFGSRAALADALGKARIDQAMRRAQDIANAQAQFGATGNMMTQNIMGPAALGADFLSNRMNVDTNSLIEQMRAMAGLGITEALRKRYDTSTLEAFLPAITGLLGNFLGGMSGGGGG